MGRGSHLQGVGYWQAPAKVRRAGSGMGGLEERD